MALPRRVIFLFLFGSFVFFISVACVQERKTLLFRYVSPYGADLMPSIYTLQYYRVVRSLQQRYPFFIRIVAGYQENRDGTDSIVHSICVISDKCEIQTWKCSTSAMPKKLSTHAYTNHQPERTANRQTNKYSSVKREEERAERKSTKGKTPVMILEIQKLMASTYQSMVRLLELPRRLSTCQSTDHTKSPAIGHPSSFV